MTTREQFLEFEKLIDKKLKNENKYFKKQNLILQELINKKDEVHAQYLLQNKELKDEILELKNDIENSVNESKLLRETCNKSIGRYSTMYLFIIVFGILSLLLYGFKH